MNSAEFLATIRLNPANAAILDRLPELGAPQAHLVAGALFQTVWNVRGGQAPAAGIRDYDLFYWDPDTGYEAEDAFIRRAAALFADLGVRPEVRNQARVHLWFPEKHGLTRPPIRSAREGIDQFLVECTCVGVNAHGALYAPSGLADLAAGVLRPNPRSHTPALYAAKVADYRARWPWLREG
ncbi:nucleotidyltransferase family protein [Deinococcus sp. MIMF12]|uniref:Nucleotidyltransferase family protein n=1 Tax=Deinococcus rhizophilus TaxID=3049544 RepID=A0ABT7JF17_9DEIO|nr:nucleotidyltransferase family protein [Deinococcus rhizophilus]MDL2343650.1 nucleotidyltransferase family protein [Deinococcus rhizophilus]